MKITKQYLQKLIKEELQSLIENNQTIDLSKLERGPKKTIGRQGWTADQMIDLINHILGTKHSPDDLREVILDLRSDEEKKQIIKTFVEKNPVKINDMSNLEPDFPYEIVDGHHRATLFQLLNIREIPAIISK